MTSKLEINQAAVELHALEDATSRAFAKTLTHPVILEGPAESLAFERKGIILEATGSPAAKLEASGLNLQIIPGKGGVKRYGKVDYIEFPNSTMLETVDPKSGKARSWLLARGVRKYSTSVQLKNGKINPQGYVSDVLLFEIKDSAASYRSRLITSNSDAKFFFEDPRISVLYAPDGSQRIILSGTDYSPHVPGAVDPDVMNRYLFLELDHRGVPKAPKANALGIPKFENLSPFPKKIGDKILSIDAKNATFATNELGQIIVRTRLRPDFNFPEMKLLAGDDQWKYAEQVFVFNSFEDLTKYNWDHCLEDLFSKGPVLNESRVRPLLAKTIIRDSQIKELFKDSKVALSKGKGLGPGTPPVRVVRRDNKLFISGGKNAKEHFAGDLSKNFHLKEGEVKFITFDHEIRYFMDSRKGQDFLKRHYSLSVKQFDKSLTKIESYFGDALSPKTPHELGLNSGIADLQHVYPMGWQIVTGKDGMAKVRLSLGVSDAHTEIVEVDMLTLLKEMAPDSSRRKSGQVYDILEIVDP